MKNRNSLYYNTSSLNLKESILPEEAQYDLIECFGESEIKFPQKQSRQEQDTLTKSIISRVDKVFESKFQRLQNRLDKLQTQFRVQNRNANIKKNRRLNYDNFGDISSISFQGQLQRQRNQIRQFEQKMKKIAKQQEQKLFSKFRNFSGIQQTIQKQVKKLDHKINSTKTTLDQKISKMRKESGDHPKKVFINDESDAKILKIKKGTESIIDLLNEKIIGLQEQVQMNHISFTKFKENKDLMEEFEPKEYKNKYNIEISPKHTHTNRLFKFQKNSATYRGEKDIETQIILNRIIPQEQVYTIKCKLVNSNNVIMGITNINKTQNKRSSYDSGHSVCKSCSNGNIYFRDGKETLLNYSQTVKDGQILIMEVNFRRNYVRWFTENDEQRGMAKFQKQNNAIYAPYFELNSPESTIKWVQAQPQADSE